MPPDTASAAANNADNTDNAAAASALSAPPTPAPPTMRILALHGFTGSGEDFAPLRAACPPSWQWHTPDLPGHATRAAAAASEFEPDALLRHLLQQLETLPANTDGEPAAERNARHRHACDAADTRPVLLGYSMGGRLALHLAALAPHAFSALVLIGASPGIADPAERARRRAADDALACELENSPAAAPPLAAFFENWWSLPLLAPMRRPEFADIRARRLRENTVSGLAASLRANGTGALPPLWDALPNLPLPVLCIAGADDPKFAAIASQMAARNPRAAAAAIPRAGHLPHLEQPAATARALAAFLATTPVARQCLLGLGSNLGDRAARLHAAAAALDALPGTRLLVLSPFHETVPVGYLAQPDFLNAAAAVATVLSPEELHAHCQRIEAENGRVRVIPNGPRTLDIDLLFYEGVVRSTPALTLPHPRWRSRPFVLAPLAELLRSPALAPAARWDFLRHELRLP